MNERGSATGGSAERGAAWREAAPRFSKGVRFRRLEDGSGVLLVPEGVVNLSESASSIAALVDGVRTIDVIAAQLAEQFDAPRERIAVDVKELLDRFARNTWLDRGDARTEGSSP